MDSERDYCAEARADAARRILPKYQVVLGCNRAASLANSFVRYEGPDAFLEYFIYVVGEIH